MICQNEWIPRPVVNVIKLLFEEICFTHISRIWKRLLWSPLAQKLQNNALSKIYLKTIKVIISTNGTTEFLARNFESASKGKNSFTFWSQEFKICSKRKINQSVTANVGQKRRRRRRRKERLHREAEDAKAIRISMVGDRLSHFLLIWFSFCF